MKSRHLSAMSSTTTRLFWRSLPWLAALLLLSLASVAFAQAEADPPGRVAFVSARDGSVVFAPQGEEDWVELPQNRPLTAGDRLWSDRGARAELQLGSATLHVDSESHVGLSELDDRAAQFILQQGSVNARVRELAQGENFEIGTPNVAFRALQPGDYRIDVDTQSGETRIVVASGMAAVFGEGGESVQLGAGQQASFAGRSLAQVNSPRFRQDDFAAWAANRNQLEDLSIAARHVPRGVVGYAQLDQHGSWSQDANLGAVWYPRVVVQDWAPYRYGHWSWIQPWGWTWVDDAPWGFAPFHYGRWTMIGHRWAWVPGRMAARPVYSPALVVFMGGGGSQFSFSVGNGPGVGWYPLAPGEAWWPTYRTSPRYVNFANFNINLGAYPRHYRDHHWRHRHHAITAVREEDFRRARPVQRHWQSVLPQVAGQAQIGVAPQRPDFRREREASPRLHAAPAGAMPAAPHRIWGREIAPAVLEQHRAAREQERLQREAERGARQQMRQAEEQRRAGDRRHQQEQVFRQQQEVVRQQHERAQRDAWQQRREQERDSRRSQREEGQVPHRLQPWQQMLPPATQQPQLRQQAPAQIQRGEGRREGRGEGGRQRHDDGGRGRGHGGWQRNG